MFPPLIQELIEFDNTRQRRQLAIAPHVHHCFQMDLVLSGVMQLVLPDRSVVLRAGDGTLLPPLSVHGFAIDRSAHYVSFKFHVHPRYYSLFTHYPRVFRFPGSERALAARVPGWDPAADVSDIQRAAGAATICLSHAIRILRVREPVPQVSLSTQELWSALNAVVSRPEADWSVKKLAGMCSWSEGHFSKMFVQWFRQSPRRFLLESRMSVATRMLQAGEMSIKQVAERCGYATVHSFSRAFKRVLGVTPARYVNPHERL